MFVELVGGSGVQHIDLIYALPIGFAVEAYGIKIDVLAEVLIGLQRESKASVRRRSLKWIYRMLVNAASIVEPAADMDRPNNLHVAEHIDTAARLETASRPGFSAAGIGDA